MWFWHVQPRSKKGDSAELGNPTQGGVHSKLFDQCMELGNPKAHSRQGLDL